MHFISHIQPQPQQHLPQNPDPSTFMHNIHIKQLFIINQTHLALISSHSIIIYNNKLNLIARFIDVEMQIQAVIYLKDFVFYAYAPLKKELLSIEIGQEDFKIGSVYKFKDNPGKNDYEWSPWLFYLQKSQKVIMVRKFYGLSWIIIFKIHPYLCREWDFTCNQSDLRMLDSQRYLVNYNVINNRHNIKFQIYNISTQTRSTFKIQNFNSSNIVKSMQLYSHTLQQTLKSQTKSWVTILLAINYKSKGSAILLLKCLEQSNNTYQMLLNVDLNNLIAQIYDVLENQMIVACQYRYDQQSKMTNCYLVSYRLDQISNKIEEVSQIMLCQEIEMIKYSKLQKELVIVNSSFKYKSLETDDGIDYSRQFYRYKIVQKQCQYLHLLSKMTISENLAFTTQVLALLSQ